MIPEEFRIEIADFRADHAALRAVRERVFIQEQQVPREIEEDALDPQCRHVLARDAAGVPIGTGRLTPDRRIGRLAVLPEWRGRGVGDSLLQTLIDLARGLGWSEVTLHAQVDAIGFYRRAGFETMGEPYLEAGIAHQTMRRALEPFAEARRPPLPPLPESRERTIESLHEASEVTLALIRQARRRLWIYTRDLDPLLFGTPQALEAIKQFAIQRHDVQLRILVQEPVVAARECPGLIALAQRLSSSVLIRVPDTEPDRQYPAAFVLDDSGGYLYRPIGSRFEGTANLHAPGHQRQLRDYFEQVWERAASSPELRPVHI